MKSKPILIRYAEYLAEKLANETIELEDDDEDECRIVEEDPLLFVTALDIPVVNIEAVPTIIPTPVPVPQVITNELDVQSRKIREKAVRKPRKKKLKVTSTPVVAPQAGSQLTYVTPIIITSNVTPEVPSEALAEVPEHNTETHILPGNSGNNLPVLANSEIDIIPHINTSTSEKIILNSDAKPVEIIPIHKGNDISLKKIKSSASKESKSENANSDTENLRLGTNIALNMHNNTSQIKNKMISDIYLEASTSTDFDSEIVNGQIQLKEETIIDVHPGSEMYEAQYMDESYIYSEIETTENEEVLPDVNMQIVTVVKPEYITPDQNAVVRMEDNASPIIIESDEEESPARKLIAILYHLNLVYAKFTFYYICNLETCFNVISW